MRQALQSKWRIFLSGHTDHYQAGLDIIETFFFSHLLQNVLREAGGMGTVTTPTSMVGIWEELTDPSLTASTGTPGADTTTGRLQLVMN